MALLNHSQTDLAEGLALCRDCLRPILFDAIAEGCPKCGGDLDSGVDALAVLSRLERGERRADMIGTSEDIGSWTPEGGAKAA